jgi:hypothetical protein
MGFSLAFKGLMTSPNIIRVIKLGKMRWTVHVARKRDRRGAYRVWVGRPGGRPPLGTPTRRLKYTVKTELQEMGWRARTGLIWLRIGSGGEVL